MSSRRHIETVRRELSDIEDLARQCRNSRQPGTTEREIFALITRLAQVVREDIAS
jgi:hypothetical protein